MLKQIKQTNLRRWTLLNANRLKRSEAQTERLVQDFLAEKTRYNTLTALHREGNLFQAAHAVFEHFVEILKRHDPASFQHSLRVAKISALLARELALGEDYALLIGMAAQLHKIGTVFLPGMKSTSGADAVEAQQCVLGDTLLSGTHQQLSMAANIARSQNERFDGNGYPDGLRGQSIPLEARVFAIAHHLEGRLMPDADGRVILAAKPDPLRPIQWQGRHFDTDIMKLVENFIPLICLSFADDHEITRRA
ncbi:MAG: HD domain-containing phosphohydrolase [Nitrosomonadales bacterium]|jgi:response regulator RpfG family c-di-GMP phosphodiesterase